MTALTAMVTAAYNPMLTSVEAHLSGCKAATRRIKGYVSEVNENAFDVALLIEMQANPDEGGFKIHDCLKPTLAAARKELA